MPRVDWQFLRLARTAADIVALLPIITFCLGIILIPATTFGRKVHPQAAIIVTVHPTNMPYLIRPYLRLCNLWIGYPSPLPWQVGHTRRGRQERSERRVPFVVHALRAPDVVKRHSIAVGMAQKFRLRREVGPDRVPSVGVIPYQVSFEETVEVRLDVVVMRDVSPASRANFHVRRNEAIDGIAHEGHPQGANGLVQIPLIVFGVGRLVLQFCHGSDVSSQGGGTALGDVAERDRMRVNMNGVVPSRMMVR
mmetsp:Transcript_14527/g.35020  ORF Transcript_14527/g.35020 Transcript_14527/m.35020 type:complete len:251 (-) Transcript_14527:297-1049(-)